MGYATGHNNQGRWIGYAITSICDRDDCENNIDLGLGFVCGGPDGPGNAGMENEPYCGDYFCEEHLTIIPALEDGEFQGSLQVCMDCAARQKCPACNGDGHDKDGENCETCDSHGVHAQRDEKLV